MREQRRDAAAVVARAGEPGVVVRAEHDHAARIRCLRCGR